MSLTPENLNFSKIVTILSFYCFIYTITINLVDHVKLSSNTYNKH